MGYVIVKYIHLLGVLVLFATLAMEHLLIRDRLSPMEMQRLARIDRIYGLSAVVVLTAGLLLWFAVGKPAGFYTANPVFHAKLGLFIVIGLLSIYPTRFVLRHRTATEETAVPVRIRQVMRAQLLLLLLMPLLAVLMAQGYGLR